MRATTGVLRAVVIVLLVLVASGWAPTAGHGATDDVSGYSYDGIGEFGSVQETRPSDGRSDQAELATTSEAGALSDGYDDSVNSARSVVRLNRYRSAPNTAGRAAGLADDGVNVIPSSGRTFVGTPRGTVYDVPQGWAPRVADNGRGIVYQRPGALRNADSIRIMEPTSKYPSGYARYYNSGNQPLDVFGNPGADPVTHIPQDYVGPWPGWPL